MIRTFSVMEPDSLPFYKHPGAFGGNCVANADFNHG